MGVLFPDDPTMPFRIAALVAVLFVTGCQTASGVREPIWPYPTPPTVPPDQSPGGQPPVTVPSVPPTALPPYGLPDGQGGAAQPDWPRDAKAVSGPAVQALMAQADASRAAQRPDDAAASLERAARIEPRNAFVWSSLAAVYIDQGNYDQAEALAQRSNSMARGNPFVQVQNWRVIAAARSGRGDAGGSLQAQARVEELQAGLPRE